MGSDINGPIRRRVAERAGFRCEYCLIHQDDAYYPHQIDHIVSRKHGGHSRIDNLAYACAMCNRFKGTDLGSIHPNLGLFVRLFNPRKQVWHDHFNLRGPVIVPISNVGDVTVQLFKLNLDKRITERQMLIDADRYGQPLSGVAP